MRLLISFIALFLSIFLLQLSSGAVGPLDAISGLSQGFTRAEVGLLGSAHFVGFFVGCWWAPRLLGTVGYSRTFAAFTALGAIGLLAHMLVVDARAWALMRVASGVCVAGCYTVIEAWLHAKVTNETRGRATGVYRVVDISGALVAQLMVGVLPPASYAAYNILAILCCASLIPLTLTRLKQPETPSAPRLHPSLAFRLSPLAAFAVMIAGMTSGAFRMVGPIYGNEIGLDAQGIGYFLAGFVLGGAIAQYPAGWLADKFDRRWILIWLSSAAVASCALTITAGTARPDLAVVFAAVFGLTTFPIFSVAAAHAHDFATSDQRVELSAALMFCFAMGAIASPIVTSTLIEWYGAAALFVFISVFHLVLVVFGIVRMLARPSKEARTPYVYVPRTSFIVGRLLRRQRDARIVGPAARQQREDT
ncbi:MAG: MFS transporter [Pseudomonadota bacterium]